MRRTSSTSSESSHQRPSSEFRTWTRTSTTSSRCSRSISTCSRPRNSAKSWLPRALVRSAGALALVAQLADVPVGGVRHREEVADAILRRFLVDVLLAAGPRESGPLRLTVAGREPIRPPPVSGLDWSAMVAVCGHDLGCFDVIDDDPRRPRLLLMAIVLAPADGQSVQ